ncbi:MAG: ribosome maturation factor RimM [Syntrophomonas sp.]
MQKNELISIGRIAGTYGYAGFLKVVPLTDFPERFFELTTVKIQKGDQIREVVIDSVKAYKNGYLFKFQGIDSSEAGREYRNALLMIDENQLYPLPEGYYYYFQLEGMNVFDEEKGFLGKIKEVLETGANDVYVVTSEKYGEILIPALKDVIVEINVEAKEMKVKLLPGLIDE